MTDVLLSLGLIAIGAGVAISALGHLFVTLAAVTYGWRWIWRWLGWW